MKKNEIRRGTVEETRKKWVRAILLVPLLLGWSNSRSLAQVAPVQPNEKPSSDLTVSPIEGAPSSNIPEIFPVRKPESAKSFVESLRTNDATFEVVVGQGRILTTKTALTSGQNQALIAVGDPSVIDFAVVSPRQLRITGQRIGVTDLSITTSDGNTHVFEVRVVADLGLLQARLKGLFPDAKIELGQVRDSIVVEGQARSNAQIAKILDVVRTFLDSVERGQSRTIQGRQFSGVPGATGGEQPPGGNGNSVPPPPSPGVGPSFPGAMTQPTSAVSNELSAPVQVQGAVVPLRVINLMRVPGSTQVMLKVRIAELNRSAMRQIGANFLGVNPRTGAIVGSQIGQNVGAFSGIGQATANPTLPGHTLNGAAAESVSTATTVFGIFQNSNFEFTLEALRKNAMAKILAEPNLVAMSGYSASFLAGGEFPVPVPQSSAGGVSPTITVRFREFGVRLAFLPYILENDVIRLSVAPEVSQIDFTISTTLVAGGTPVPGLNTRKAQTTVELRQGQTLAIAGLLQLNLDGQTTRIPGLGDLPIIGPFFSNTTGQRVEKELVVLVTPYLIEPMNPDQVPPSPGDEVKEPNDLELYFLNRFEGRTGKDFRATTKWDDPFGLVPLLKLEKNYISGPSGFSN